VYLDLMPDWPREDIAADLFHLHTVPAENLRREPAMTLTCDGTQDALAIRHPHPEQGYALRSVLGVYLIGESGLQPLRSSALPDPPAMTELSGFAAAEALSYQFEERLTPIGRRPYLIVRAPGALLEPRRLQVDALWYQPGFAQEPIIAVGPGRPALIGRVLDGLDWQLLGGVRAEGTSALRREVSGLLRVLSMSMRPVLPQDELRWLMQVLVGNSGPASYRSMPTRLDKFSWSVSPDSSMRKSGLRHVYKGQLQVEPGEDEALAWFFLYWMRQVLDAWNQESSIDLFVDTGDTALKLAFVDPPPSPEGA
jgi:type VI secretion system protein ImpG